MKFRAAEYNALRTTSVDTTSCFIDDVGVRHGRIATEGDIREPKNGSCWDGKRAFQTASLKPGTICISSNIPH